MLFATALCVAAVISLILGERVSAQAGAIIRACVAQNGNVQIVGPTDACKQHETLVTWNAQGPQGPVGATGPAGPLGPTGADGAAGRDGRDGRDGQDGQAGGPPVTIDAVMKVDGVTGIDSAATTPIFSFSLGATNTSTVGGGSGGGAGRANFQDVSLAKMLDGFSVPLLRATATGLNINLVTILMTHVGETSPFAVYGFHDVVITADMVGASTTGINESLSFNYRQIVSDITLNGATFHSCYDVALNRPC